MPIHKFDPERLSINLDLGNDTMLTGNDAAKVLRNIATKLEAIYGDDPLDTFHRQNVKDANGNVIGSYGCTDVGGDSNAAYRFC